jgi:hypothetical protein
MAVYNQNQLISASNATYTTNGANEITAADVRNLNNSWVSSSALISGSNTFYNDQIISGSLNVIGGITGSLFGTATSASHAVTASFALNSSGGSGFPFNGNAIITGSLTISGSNDYPLNIKGLYIGKGAGTNSTNFTIGSVNSLYNNTTGNDNTAIGYDSLSNNSTGDYNIAVGNRSLLVNGSGAYNVAVGYQALESNVIGGNNIALGSLALRYTNANANIGIGLQSINLNTSGNYNVAIGENALANIATGDSNTAIGTQAGINANGSSTRNVYIGLSAGPSSTVQESNKLYIHNAPGTPLIGGDFNTGTVTLNNILVLTPRTTNPSNPASGSIIVSGSGADFKPYFWNGSTWTSLI